MGSKINPGKFDCYEKALPDEPMMVLLGRDPLAPYLTQIWAMLRTGNRNDAGKIFTAMLLDPHTFVYNQHPNEAEAIEALDCSFDMKRWRRANDGAWRKK
jgi:hypothetical protein